MTTRFSIAVLLLCLQVQVHARESNRTEDIYVDIPYPEDKKDWDQVCKRICYGQTSPGILGPPTDSRQQWEGAKFPKNHVMFLGTVDMTECGFTWPPVVSVSLAAKSINER